MAFRMTRHLKVGADEALAHITARAGLWRESELPPELVSALIFGVTVRRKERRFELHLDSQVRNSWPVLIGDVIPESDRSCIVRARVGSPPRLDAASYVIFGALTLWCLLYRNWSGAAILAGLSGIAYFFASARDRAISYEADRGARLLADRLDQAIASDLRTTPPTENGAEQRLATDGRSRDCAHRFTQEFF